MLKKKLGEEVWTQKRAIMLAWLKEQVSQLPVTLHSRAYIGVGQKSN
jgi:hypothetical protein